MEHEEPISEYVGVTIDAESSAANSVEQPVKKDRYAGIRAHAFKPGHSGNPHGRAKKGPLTESLALIMSKKVPKETLAKMAGNIPIPRKATYADLMAYAMVQQVLKGNVNAMREILNRIEGRNTHHVNLTTTDKLDELRQALLAGPVEPGTRHPPQDDDEDEDDD